MEIEEEELEQYVAFKQVVGELPDLFDRREGLDEDVKYPCFFHVHRIADLSIVYMDDQSCKQFGLTLKEIQNMGAQFSIQMTHAKDLARAVESIIAFVSRGDENEILTYFQRVKLNTDNNEGYRLVLTAIKLDLKNNLLFCISNLTDQLPILTKKICHALNEKHDIQKKAQLYLTLTNREIEIMEYLGKGMQVKELAEQLNLSSRTIEQHKKNIYKKLNINTLAEVIAFASTF